jgi:uncharacterized coiled-coil DUF342 family protein
MRDKNELLRLVRRAKSAIDDIESKADDIEANPDSVAEEIKSLADDAAGYLKKLLRAIEELELADD